MIYLPVKYQRAYRFYMKKKKIKILS